MQLNRRQRSKRRHGEGRANLLNGPCYRPLKLSVLRLLQFGLNRGSRELLRDFKSGTTRKQCSIQVEQQYVRRLVRADIDRLVRAESGSIATAQRFSVERHFTLSHMHPGMASRGQLMTDPVAPIQFRHPKVGVLMNSN